MGLKDFVASTKPPSEDGGEVPIRAGRARRGCTASTKPPSEDGGEGHSAPLERRQHRRLQRSRRPKTAESAASYSAWIRSLRLQRSRRPKAAERRTLAPPCPASSPLQRSRRPKTAER